MCKKKKQPVPNVGQNKSEKSVNSFLVLAYNKHARLEYIARISSTQQFKESAM
jgi:hypothetical protein